MSETTFDLVKRKCPLRCLNCNATPPPPARAAAYKSGEPEAWGRTVPSARACLRMAATATECVVIVEEAEDEEEEEERSVAIDSTSTAVGSAESEDDNNSGRVTGRQGNGLLAAETAGLRESMHNVLLNRALLRRNQSMTNPDLSQEQI